MPSRIWSPMLLPNGTCPLNHIKKHYEQPHQLKQQRQASSKKKMVSDTRLHQQQPTPSSSSTTSTTYLTQHRTEHVPPQHHMPHCPSHPHHPHHPHNPHLPPFLPTPNAGASRGYLNKMEKVDTTDIEVFARAWYGKC